MKELNIEEPLTAPKISDFKKEAGD